MVDTKANIEIVYAKLKNARLYNPHNTGALPADVSPASELGRIIDQVANKGDGVMIHGESIRKQSDGSEKNIGLITVMGNLSNNEDILVRNRVVILVTSTEGNTKLDKVVAGGLEYRTENNPSTLISGPAEVRPR